MELFTNTTFKLFLEEIAALGFTVSATPKSGALPYGVIGGRSNARWWLVPLNNRHVATSGLALFQPILPSTRIIKGFASILNSVGLSSLWARNKVYISCPPVFSDLFDVESFSYSFFTGTESPHRKTAIQIMDSAGEIKGFAKVSRNPLVKPLLKHETEILNYLNTLELKTVLIPKVLFYGEIDRARIFITDSLKTAKTKTPTTLGEAHFAFLRELEEKTCHTNPKDNDWLITDLRKQYESCAKKLPEDWQKRLLSAINVLARSKIGSASNGLSHGDFTPWNTFSTDGKLYVFDWEYASYARHPGFDLLHFSLSKDCLLHKMDAHALLVSMKEDVIRFGGEKHKDYLGILPYLLSNCLFYIQREPCVNSGYFESRKWKVTSELIDLTSNSKYVESGGESRPKKAKS